jgi:uncharacterized phage protein (TIGR01671 family)
MKEIRFRAWDTYGKFMYSSFSFDDVAGEDGNEAYINTKPRQLNPSWIGESGAILMQFTGLHDKNGVEIYEGDILRGELWLLNPEEPQMTHGIAVVVWYQANVQYHLVDQDEYNYGNIEERTDQLDETKGWQGFEVIGNVYETLELLK